MKVIRRVKGYAQDPNRYFHLSEYEKSCGDFVLIEAGFSKPLLWKEYGFDAQTLEQIFKKKIVRIEFDEPNKLYVADYPWEYDHQFSKILTICPYTADWLNKKYGEKKRIPIFFPIHEKYIPKPKRKIYDILYAGHLYGSEIRNEVKPISAFHYCLVSNSKDRLVTHRSVSYEKKLDLIAKSKITLVHNLFFRTYLHRTLNVWRGSDFWNNKAFEEFPVPWRPWELFTKSNHVPQLKSRAFEAAACRSLILCRKDSFNVIERYFTPGKEFVYYEPGKLESSIRDILAHYDAYLPIIQRAHNRLVRQYTMAHFVKKYLKTL